MILCKTAEMRMPVSFMTALGAMRRKIGISLCLIGCVTAKGQIIPINADADTLRGIVLKEVVVGRTKNHYTKRNNPAVEFANRIRSAREKGDPRRHEYYGYRKYERISLGINDFQPGDSVSGSGGRFGFLREHADTSDVTGLPILPLSIKEKTADVLYRRDPHAEKQYVRGVKREGIDEFADLDNIQTILEDAFREVDLYEDDIPLLRNRFVSPLSKIGPDFYRYFLTDTTHIDGVKCVVLSFAPRNPATFGFLGRIYVEADDTTMFVKKVDMGVSPTINLNFVDRLRINQRFDKAPDGSRLKTLDDMNIEFSMISGVPEIYARRTTSYDNHSFQPYPDTELYEMSGEQLIAEDANEKDEYFWKSERQVKAGYNENRIPLLMQRLRNVPIYRYGEMALRIFVKGYVSTARTDSKFDIGPLNTFISGNSIEGLRLRAGGITTANLSRRWFGRGYVAYGFKDKKWKYNAEIEYSFNDKKYHSREFPIHSIMVSEKYDIDQLGQNYAFTNADNMFLSLKRGSNHLISYKRESRLAYNLELENHFSLSAEGNIIRMDEGPFLKFIRTDGTEINHYNQLSLKLKLRYAPGEKFIQTKSDRFPINHDAPEIILSHEYVPKGVFGAPWGVNRTELSVQKRFWFSAFGYTDVMVKGGYIWGKTSFPNLMSPNANLSYTIQRESFSLLNPLEFMNDGYVSWFVTYWANGLLFNQIPYVKKLKLREVIGFRGWVGTLRKTNNPDLSSYDGLLRFPTEANTTLMHGKPYMEISAGLDNVFRCLRIDYVWRLSYKDVPCADRSGLRIALHLTF